MNSIQDSLILLASARESMVGTAEKIQEWDVTQDTIEKSAYESMNAADEVLNLSREGAQLVDQLLECCNTLMQIPGEEACQKTQIVLEELSRAFDRISKTSSAMNEVAHTIEQKVADQKEIEEDIKGSISTIEVKLNEVVANTEMYLALKDYIFE